MLHHTCRWSPFNDKHMYVTLPGWSRQGHSVTFPGCRPHPWPGLPTLETLPGWSRHGCSVTFPGCPPHPEPVCRPLYLCLGGQDKAVPSPFQGASLTLSQSTNPGIVTIGIVTTGIFGLACVALPSCLATNIIACVFFFRALRTIFIFPPGFRREGSAPSGTFSGIQHLGPDPCWNPPKGRLYGNGRPSLPGVHRSGAFRSASPHPPGKKSLS